MSDRNPFVLPDSNPKKRGCPKCGHGEFLGRRIGGVVHFTCRNTECNNKWQGGLPHELIDPSTPYPANPNPPSIEQMALRDKDGNIVDTYEIRRPVSHAQPFRGGAKIPEGEDI